MVRNKVIAAYWGYRATQARQRGRYTAETQAWFKKAWLASQAPDDLLALCLFQRDRGFKLRQRWQSPLLASTDHLKPNRRLLAYALLLENHVNISTPFLHNTGEVQLPAVLKRLAQEHLSREQQLLREIATQQESWRQAFKQQLQQWVATDGLCVVGNAAGLLHEQLGQQIDQHTGVVRFNTVMQGVDYIPHIGQHMQVWVITPQYQVQDHPSSLSACQWVIVTGAEIQYRQLNWQHLLPIRLAGKPLLTIPLSIWRCLVRELQAPPSAGIVFLAWAHALLGSWQGISVAGFGALLPPNVRYHLSTHRHKPNQRHNWQGEARLLQRWLAEGLHSLHD